MRERTLASVAVSDLICTKEDIIVVIVDRYSVRGKYCILYLFQYENSFCYFAYLAKLIASYADAADSRPRYPDLVF